MKFAERVMSRELRKWSDITSDPFWYRKIGREKLVFLQPSMPGTYPRALGNAVLTSLDPEIDSKQPTKKLPQHTLYLIFEELLANEQVRLGSTKEGCYDWDSERQELKAIVVHHSKSPEPMRSHYLSAMELLRIYVPTYNFPDASDRNRPGVVGKPVYSGHYDSEARQGFWIYHWLVESDGTAIRYLDDDQTGWHAGKWAVNCSCAGICIDDDLTDRGPNQAQLEGVAQVIEANYGQLDIGPDTILGHNEVKPSTACPGALFLPRWKGQLLSMLGA